MPSMAHDVLVDLFKNRPSLGPELLTEALGVALPAYTEARLISIDLTKVRPAQYLADVVVLLLDGDVPIWVLIVEVQLGIDPRKRFSGPSTRRACAPSVAVPPVCWLSPPTPTSPHGVRSRSRSAPPASC